jgi:hypothetical protein
MEGRVFLRCLANIPPPTAYRIRLKVLVGLYIATFPSCPLITLWLCLTLIFPMYRWQPSISDLHTSPSMQTISFDIKRAPESWIDEEPSLHIALLSLVLPKWKVKGVTGWTGLARRRKLPSMQYPCQRITFIPSPHIDACCPYPIRARRSDARAAVSIIHLPSFVGV